MFSELLVTLDKYGLFGIFLTSFIGNAIPYSAVPYLAFIAAYAAATETASKLAIAISGGIGAAMGKFLLYAIARYAGKRLSKEKREDLMYFQDLFRRKKTDILLIFLFAALPLPDDVLYVPLGLARFNFLKFAVTVILGKVFLVGFTAFLGSQARWLIETSIGGHYLLIAIIALIIATIYLLLIIFYTDWKKIVKVLSEEGKLVAFKVFMKEMFNILLLRHPRLRKRRTRKNVKNVK